MINNNYIINFQNNPISMSQNQFQQDNQVVIKRVNNSNNNSNYNQNEENNSVQKKQLKIIYSIEQFENDNEGLFYFVGFKKYEYFIEVFFALGPQVHYYNFKKRCAVELTPKNQLFLVLWKLRRNCTDLELSKHFCIEEKDVHHLVKTWISYMSKTWAKTYSEPEKDIIKFFLPHTFKIPSPKVHENSNIPMLKFRKPHLKPANYLITTNNLAIKVLTECTLEGKFSIDIPKIRARNQKTAEKFDQKFQKSNFNIDVNDSNSNENFPDKVPENDQNNPEFKKTKNTSPNVILTDEKLAKYKEHMEKMINSLRRYKILSTTLEESYISISPEILSVCVMLYNFK